MFVFRMLYNRYLQICEYKNNKSQEKQQKNKLNAKINVGKKVARVVKCFKTKYLRTLNVARNRFPKSFVRAMNVNSFLNACL